MGQSCGMGHTQPVAQSMQQGPKTNKNVFVRTPNPLNVPVTGADDVLCTNLDEVCTESMSPIPKPKLVPNKNSDEMQVTSIHSETHVSTVTSSNEARVLPADFSSSATANSAPYIISVQKPSQTDQRNTAALNEALHKRSPLPLLTPIEVVAPSSVNSQQGPMHNNNISHHTTPMTATGVTLAGANSLPLFISDNGSDNSHQLPISIAVPVEGPTTNCELTNSSSVLKAPPVSSNKGLPLMQIVHASPAAPKTGINGVSMSDSPKFLNRRDGSSLSTTTTTTKESSAFSAEHSDVKLPLLTSISIPYQKQKSPGLALTPLARDSASEVPLVNNSTSDSSGMLAVVYGVRQGVVDQGSSGVESTFLAYPSASMYMRAMGLGGSASVPNGGSNVSNAASYSATIDSLPSINNSVHVFSGDHPHFKVSRVTASVFSVENRSNAAASGELLSFDPFPNDKDKELGKMNPEISTENSTQSQIPPGSSKDFFPSTRMQNSKQQENYLN